MIDVHAPGLIPDSFVVGQDGFGSPIDNLLDRPPEADGDAQHRGAKSLDSLAAVAVESTDLSHQGQSRGPKPVSNAFGV